MQASLGGLGPLFHMSQGGGNRKEGASLKPLPLLSSVEVEWPEPFSLQGWAGDQACWWLRRVLFKQHSPFLSHTHSLHSHLVSLNAQSLRPPVQKTKASRFHSRKPQRPSCSACLLSWPVWSGQEPEKWQLSCLGERGPCVVGLGPLWDPYPREEPVSLTPMDTPLLARSRARWGGSGSWPVPQPCRPHDLSC